jgi:hypothetical protein
LQPPSDAPAWTDRRQSQDPKTVNQVFRGQLAARPSRQQGNRVTPPKQAVREQRCLSLAAADFGCECLRRQQHAKLLR